MTDSLSEVVPFLKAPPKWLVVAGVGTGIEAQDAVKRWPEVQVIGLDPDIRAITWQEANGWPAKQPLICAALSFHTGLHEMSLDDGVNLASLHKRQLDVARVDNTRIVPTLTLDKVWDYFAPRGDGLLWLDTEDWEWAALLGGRELLASGKVILINLEVRKGIEDETARAAELLAAHGYARRHVWFEQWWGHNEVWTHAGGSSPGSVGDTIVS